MPNVKPTLTLAALKTLDGAAAVEEFTFGIRNRVIRFPDPLSLDAEETERFMADMQDLSSPMTVMKRWLSEEDYQTLLDAHLTGRQAIVLLREANRHYEALLGDQGEGRSSGTA